MDTFPLSRRMFTFGGAAAVSSFGMPSFAKSDMPAVLFRMSFRGKSYGVAIGKSDENSWLVGLRDLKTGDWVKIGLKDSDNDRTTVLKTDTVQAEITENEKGVFLNGTPLFESDEPRKIVINEDGEEICIDQINGIGGAEPTAQGFWKKLGKVLGGIGKILAGVVLIAGGGIGILGGIGSIFSGIGDIVSIFEKTGTGVMARDCENVECDMWEMLGDYRF